MLIYNWNYTPGR